MLVSFAARHGSDHREVAVTVPRDVHEGLDRGVGRRR